MKSLNFVGTAIQAATAIATTIASINDMEKRRHFEEALALLNSRQQQELNERLVKVNTQTERLRILSESMTDYVIANETSAGKQETVMIVIIASLVVVLFAGTMIYKFKNKK